MTDEIPAVVMFRKPPLIGFIALWAAAIVACVMAIGYQDPPPSAPTCDGQIMTRSDLCATVPAGTDTSAYNSVLGGADFDTMLAEEHESYLDWRWGTLVVAVLIVILAIVATRRVVIGMRAPTLPEPTGFVTWHVTSMSAGVFGVIGAVFAGSLGVQTVRHAGDGEFITDLSIEAQWIAGAVMTLLFLYLYVAASGNAAILVRTDDDGVLIVKGTRTTTVPWASITGISTPTTWPVTITANGAQHSFTSDLTNAPFLVKQILDHLPRPTGG